jgi:alkylhydroperoxidase/carboxymuconolactone decarboxylase family protein YurZ
MALSMNLPKPTAEFGKRYPKIWESFTQLGKLCHEAGPLDEKTRRLVKLALAIGAGLEGATHSAVRNAHAAGVTKNELNHVALLAITTLGFPSATRAMTWINDPKEAKH